MFNNKNLDIKRGIILPKQNSEELAEFIGILTGDGYINFRNEPDYTISVAGHKIDDEIYHLNHISPLIESLFKIRPKIYLCPNRKARSLYLRSKTLVEFFKKQGYYKNKGDIIIPEWIFSKQSYMNRFLRGLVDTDGSIAVKKRYKSVPYYPVISITIKNKDLIERIAFYLKDRGFSLWYGLSKGYDKRSRTYSFIYKVQLSGIKNLRLWKSIISFSNQKHINKLDYVMNKNGPEGI